ncbi:hypothetical protein OE88DRAFT_1726245 [Heliocybe sulcata]|uniref:Uncharacterized protein n=1 Tax=Heliocybe sulcata TaxID=5364 RepID=A0A5C3N1I5_9AGAM|nr:hypothetical protein OE88DRAFT_1726245 [Heliocybe sulcata]
MLVPRNQFSSSMRREISGPARRYASTQAAPRYHSKVRVYPFRISPADAIRNMSVAAAIPWLGPFVRSFLARWFPVFGFQPIQPVQLEALYLPAWLFDIGLTGTACIGAKHELVGNYDWHSFEPISRFSLNNDQLRKTRSIPWSPELETQYGLQTICLPFTMSPVGLDGVLRSLSHRDAVIDEKLRFDPKSVKTTFLAACPILIPVYLARYEYKLPHESFSLTVLQEAYYKQMLENRGVNPRLYPKCPVDHDLLAWTDKPAPFARFEYVFERGASSPHQSTSQLVESINTWVNMMADAPGSFQRLAHCEEMQKVDMDDLRIRTYDEEEVSATRIWLTLELTKRGMQSRIAVTLRNPYQRSKKPGRMSANVDVSVGLRKRDQTEPDTNASEENPSEETKGSQKHIMKEYEELVGHLQGLVGMIKPEWLKELHAQNKKGCSDR